MDDFDKFFEEHKKEIFAYARKNTKYNKEGYAVIPKGDEWLDEEEDALWENHYRKLIESEKAGQTN